MAKVNMASLLQQGTATSAGKETRTADTAKDVTVTKRDEVVDPEQTKRRTVDPNKVVKRLATVYTARTVYAALRQHASRQKAKGELISYGVIVLLAVDKYQDELSKLWTTADDAEPETHGLFGITVKKAAPKKVPWQLHGATPQQIRKLDDIAANWDAPNRSVLVEEALIRYLDIKTSDR